MRRLLTRRRMFEAIAVIALVVVIQVWQSRGLPAGAAPPLSGVRSDGVAINLTEFQKLGAGDTPNAAGRPVLVVFWATWCGICKAEESNIVAISRDWPVFSVAMQSGDASAVNKYLVERGIPYPALVDAEGKNAAAWGIAGVPTHFIVDARGNVRFRVVGYATTWGLRARLWWAERFAV